MSTCNRCGGSSFTIAGYCTNCIDVQSGPSSIKDPFQCLRSELAEDEVDSIALDVFLMLVSRGNLRDYAAQNAYSYAEAFIAERKARRARAAMITSATEELHA